MENKYKQIFDAFKTHGIYLPYYWRRKLHEDPAFSLTKTKSYLKAHPELSRFKNKLETYSTVKEERYRKTVRKAVIGTSIVNGKKRLFPSLYAAAKELGVPNGFGNISNAIRSGEVKYGYRWKFNGDFY